MRLTTQLALAISLGVCLVLGADGVFRFRSQLQEYESDILQDHRLLGRAVAVAAEQAWQQQGPASATSVVQAINFREHRVQIRLVRHGNPIGPLPAPAFPGLLSGMAGSRPIQAVVESADNEPSIASYIHVKIPARPGVAVELVEPLTQRKAFVRQALLSTTLSTLGLVALCTLITVAIGSILVSRPLRILIGHARRVGAGDFAARLTIRTPLEMAVLGGELNQMSEALELERSKTIEESEKKAKAQEQLRHADRLRTVGEIASGLAHELGTPLNVIRMRAHMLSTNEFQADRVPTIGAALVREADRMSNIVRTLLDYARREPVQFEQCDLVRLIHQAVALLLPVASLRNISIQTRIDADKLRILADPTQIFQVLTNILLNAIQASPANAMILVSLAVLRDSDGVNVATIAIRDEGTGIPPDTLSRIFEPFFTTKPAGEGTGLGLSIAQDIVVDHGGHISATSSSASGTTFEVRFPMRGDP